MAIYEKMSKDEFHKYDDSHPVPVIKSRHGLYVNDHHHLLRAYHELGHKNVTIIEQADFSSFDDLNFWELMEKAAWVRAVDQYGRKREYYQLPADIRGMADDPYRSLVWKLIKLGNLKKTPIPFFEFKWADYFRDKIIIRNSDSIDIIADRVVQTIPLNVKVE